MGFMNFKCPNKLFEEKVRVYMPPTVGGLAMKTSLTFCTFKLGSHVQVVKRGSDELQ